MKKALLILGVFSLIAFQGNAQEAAKLETMAQKSIETKNVDTIAWVHSGTFNLGINQGVLHNWAAGGELTSLTISGLFDATLTRYNRRKIWTSNLNAAYGLFYAYSNSFVPRKTDDQLNFSSRLGYQLTDSSNFFLVGLVNAQSQFSKGYNYGIPNWQESPTSGFISPLYLTIAPGIEYRRGGQFSVFVSPLAARGTFVNQIYTSQEAVGAFGVDSGKSFRFELGAYLSARYAKEFSKHFSLRTRLDLYSNYLAKDQYQNGILLKSDGPGDIDILWDNVLTFSFAKYFAVNIGITAIYDNDVPYQKTFKDQNGVIQLKNEPLSDLGWWQVKEIMSIGFNYKF